MIRETNPFVKGYETNKITTFRTLKWLIIDLLRGYPEYEYFGKFESVFKKSGKEVIEILSKDKVIELAPQKEGEPVRYRLTPTGINLALSIINLDYSEKVLKYSKQMKGFTIAIIIVGVLTLGIGIWQLILTLL